MGGDQLLVPALRCVHLRYLTQSQKLSSTGNQPLHLEFLSRFECLIKGEGLRGAIIGIMHSHPSFTHAVYDTPAHDTCAPRETLRP
jgi:hypothetical protein